MTAKTPRNAAFISPARFGLGQHPAAAGEHQAAQRRYTKLLQHRYLANADYGHGHCPQLDAIAAEFAAEALAEAPGAHPYLES